MPGDADNLADRDAVFFGEGKVALVVRRHAHHRAVAVAHQHIVAHPDFDLSAGKRVADENAGRQALLFHGRHVGFHHRAMFAFVDEGGQRGVVLRRACGQRMLGGNGAKSHAHEGVGTGGEHPQLAGRPLSPRPLSRKG